MESIIVTVKTNGKFGDAEFLIKEIQEFGIVNYIQYRKDGEFKKFYKQGFLKYNNEYYQLSLYFSLSNPINILKKELKGKYSITKVPLQESKYDAKGRFVGDRKAVNWSYKILN